jgi:flagellar basal-body rod modification protein FlgD
MVTYGNRNQRITHFDEKKTTTAKAEDKLGRDAFLKMFIAQMNNQDPLNPMDISQMSSQLAQYSSLEQLLNINSNLESIEGVQNQQQQVSVH